MIATNTENKSIFFSRKEHFDLYESGLRLNDGLLIEPVRGKKRRLNLNRTVFSFESMDLHEINVERTKVHMPVILGKNYKIQIELIALEESSKLGDGARYFMKSLCGKAFKLNGNYCLSAFICRGDVVRIAYDQFRFENSCVSKNTLDLKDEYLKSKVNILLEGETGSGKSHMAKEIHLKSGMPGKFVQVNLSAFSKTLIESELFGHVKGAFTGANTDKRGAIAQAQGGTLFLDEIDSLSYDLQTKLLLFLDNKEFQPVGAEEIQKVDTRLIFSTGQSLSRLVEKGDFRKDFYFRVCSGIKLKVLPLRENRRKLTQIIQSFCLENSLSISSNLEKFYRTLYWEGNIRQLIGHLELKKLSARGCKLDYCELDEGLSQTLGKKDLPLDESLSLEEVKQIYAKKVHLKMDGNLSQAAKVLAISQNTLRKLLTRK